MEDRSWSGAVAVRARIRGCLLGGAVGDALGNPVEFLSTDRIRAAHGSHGLRGLVAAGRGAPAGTVTDDTQMTLFTAEGLMRARERAAAGASRAPVPNWYAMPICAGWTPSATMGRRPLTGSRTAPGGSARSGGCTHGAHPATPASRASNTRMRPTRPVSCAASPARSTRSPRAAAR